MNLARTALVERLIRLALDEDIGTGDITTECLIDPGMSGVGRIISKESLVLAGGPVASRVFELLDPSLVVSIHAEDGRFVPSGTVLMTVEGSMRSLLTGERTALNFLQRMSGIATHVRNYLQMMKGLSLQLVDTRKTTPGLRVLEKYAVRMGGARNHRMGLFDGVLIKDNHIAACGGIAPAVSRIRSQISHLMKIEVEVSTLEQVQEALQAGVDVIMLDNMSIEMMRKAVTLIAGKALVEVSGRINAATIPGLAGAGIDIVSVGALTHSSKSVDISMDIEPATNVAAERMP
uniref:Probable nicotinate-nucleotide pyrophosphorylase [carboxylating] n=1 Tax=Desulfatirhabdium butyrativorans TaxID=340467 RepID=A0A7C4RRF2_9BACT